MAVEGLEFVSALQRLAELFGLLARAQEVQISPQSTGPSMLPIRPPPAGSPAGRRPGGRRGRRLPEGRGLDRGAIERFGIGYAPDDRNAPERAMLREGYTEHSRSMPA